MRKLLPLFLVFVLVFAACGGDDDDDSAGSIEDAKNCDDVGEVFMTDMQTLLDELSDMNLTEFTSDDEPEALTNFQTNIEEIGAKSDEIGCKDEDIQAYLEDNIDQLEADGPVAELILQSFKEGINSGDIFN